jgi:large subunit ribosomal protein L18
MKTEARERRHGRVRARLSGTAERPRLVVFRGSKILTAQLVDDAAQNVLLTVTTQGKKQPPLGAEAATQLGKKVAEGAKAAKISTVVFDRAGYRYHGLVKAVAEAAREGGLKL